ncbi:MAG: hypothetical protein HFG44_04310 [Oscillospiraceae bacterium]|jgi:hypothetical protein|nr:hypothetical protein [Oscillospiraceae bacterium]
MAKIGTGEIRRFAKEFLWTMDPDRAALAIGKKDGTALLQDKAVLRQIEAQRRTMDGQLRREDVVRRLAVLAFGKTNDCVRLVLEEKPELEELDLSLLSEVKRNEKGTVEIKLVDRLAVLEQLAALAGKEEDGSLAFLKALGTVEESI